jgi:glycine/D-amino acid oxidase-like deaminating enzyme
MTDGGDKIVIVGAGIIGVATAYYLQQHPNFGGVRIVIIDSGSVACAASGKAGGFLARDWHGTATESLGKLSYDEHERLAKEFGGEEKWGYRKLTTLSVEANANKKIGSAGKTELEWMDLVWNQSSVIGTTSTTAQVHPFLLTQFLYSQLQNVEFINAHVDSIEGDNAVILDNGQKLKFGKLVVACGVWTPRLIEKIKITGERAYSITIKTGSNPFPPKAVFLEMKMKNHERKSPEVYPRADEVYICGFSDQKCPLPNRVSDVVVDETVCRDLKAVFDETSSKLSTSPIDKMQACYLPLSDRGHPYICRIFENIYVNSGHGVWGICLSLGSGKVLAELMIDGQVSSANISALLNI